MPQTGTSTLSLSVWAEGGGQAFVLSFMVKVLCFYFITPGIFPSSEVKIPDGGMIASRIGNAVMYEKKR
jgi:hypothetical protein